MNGMLEVNKNWSDPSAYKVGAAARVELAKEFVDEAKADRADAAAEFAQAQAEAHAAANLAAKADYPSSHERALAIFGLPDGNGPIIYDPYHEPQVVVIEPTVDWGAVVLRLAFALLIGLSIGSYLVEMM